MKNKSNKQIRNIAVAGDSETSSTGSNHATAQRLTANQTLFERMEGVEEDDSEPIEADKSELTAINSFEGMPEGKRFILYQDDLPEVTIWREDTTVIVQIMEHIYTKYWESEWWHGLTFAKAMVRAIKQLKVEGHPFANEALENEDSPHIHIQWEMRCPVTTPGTEIAEKIRETFDIVCERAETTLEDDIVKSKSEREAKK